MLSRENCLRTAKNLLSMRPGPQQPSLSFPRCGTLKHEETRPPTSNSMIVAIRSASEPKPRRNPPTSRPPVRVPPNPVRERHKTPPTRKTEKDSPCPPALLLRGYYYDYVATSYTMRRSARPGDSHPESGIPNPA